MPLETKPTDSRPITGRELEKTDKPETTNKNEIERGEPTNQNDAAGSGSFSSDAVGSGFDLVQDMVASVAREKTAECYPVGGEPSLDDVRKFMASLFHGAGEYAEEWLKRMKKQGWKDRKEQPVKDWKKLAASWASGCEKKKRGIRR